MAEFLAANPFRIQDIFRYAKNPGVPHAEYTDSFPGFVFPLRGKTQFQFDGTPYIFSPGKVVHGGAKMKLAHTVFGKSNWEYILVLYQMNNFDDAGFSQQHFELLTGQSPRLVEILMRLWHAYNQQGGLSLFQAELLFRELLNETLLCVANRQNSNKSLPIFERISSYIHEHYDQSITVASLTEQNNINRNRLSYVFRRHAGVGPAEYVLNYRIKIAQKMLVTSDVPVQLIAQAVGITDPFYFSRVFKKRVGISPTQYRGKFINNPYSFQQASIHI
nr:AraC family transcriptional regulator [Paenibacillus sp. ACRSA]